MRHLYTVLLSAMLTQPVFAQGEVIAPGDPRWTSNTQGTATVDITVETPRAGFGDVGFMSLALRTNGNMNDWAFFTRMAAPDEQWGTLNNLTSLSFEWFRQLGNPPITPSDWATKSPVFRLGLSNGAELVWENWYNGKIAVTDDWVSSNLIGGNFWFHDTGFYSVTNGGVCGTGPMQVWEGIARAVTIQETVDCFGNIGVTSVSVGVGSRWDYEYTGYVDNVVVGFNNEIVVNANFDRTENIVVPEPENYILMIVGLLGLFLFRNTSRLDKSRTQK